MIFGRAILEQFCHDLVCGTQSFRCTVAGVKSRYRRDGEVLAAYAPTCEGPYAEIYMPDHKGVTYLGPLLSSRGGGTVAVRGMLAHAVTVVPVG